MCGVKHTAGDSAQRHANLSLRPGICATVRELESAVASLARPGKLKSFMDCRFGSPRRPVWMAGEKAASKADLIDKQ